MFLFHEMRNKHQKQKQKQHKKKNVSRVMAMIYQIGMY